MNNSPFAGQSGTYVTTRQVRERLFRELERNVALRVDETRNSRIPSPSAVVESSI